jgi:tetratricopeptide (TPR) repeat protein
MSERSHAEETIEGLPEDCRRTVERALLHDTDDVEGRARAFEDAVACVAELLSRDSSDADLWVFLGELEMLRDEPSRAERAFARALELDPEEPAAYSGMVGCLAAQERFDEAEAMLDRGLQIDPTPALYRQLGELELARGHFDAAEGALRSALALDPDDELALFLLARFCARDDAEARRLLEHALQVAPEHAEAWSELGALHLANDRSEEARACFEALLALDPGSPDAHRDLAVVELELDPTRALELADQALELDRDDPGSWSVRGQALARLGRSEEGEWALLTACSIRPIETEGARAHVVLADLYLELDRPAHALGTLRQVEHMAPQVPEVAAVLARAHAELGQLEDARGWLHVALEHDVEDEASRELLRAIEGEA